MGQARERTARVRVCTCSMCTCSMCTSRARSGRADRKLLALQARLLAGPGTPAGGGLVSLGSKRLVTKLIAGWIVLPAL